MRWNDALTRSGTCGPTLRKNLIFALTAILTIVLGVGASTTIFSVTNSVLLKPLPFKNPNRLVVACSDLNRHVHDFPFSNENFIDLRDGTKNVFEDMAGVFTFKQILPLNDGTPEQVRTAVVTTNFFNVMGAKIAFGRDFAQEDGLPQPPRPQPGAAQSATPPPRLPVMAILGYEYFQRRYGGDTAVIGRTIATQGPLTLSRCGSARAALPVVLSAGSKYRSRSRNLARESVELR